MEKDWVRNDDKLTGEAWRELVHKYGGELKRMNLGGSLTEALHHCWKLGLMNTKAVSIVLKSFASSDTSEVIDVVPHPDASFAHQLLQENEEPFKQRHNYFRSDDTAPPSGTSANSWSRIRDIAPSSGCCARQTTQQTSGWTRYHSSSG